MKFIEILRNLHKIFAEKTTEFFQKTEIVS